MNKPTEKMIRDVCKPITDELAERFAELSGTADDYADYMRRIPDALTAALAVEAGTDTDSDPLIDRLKGRLSFCENTGRVKDAGLYREAIHALTTSPASSGVEGEAVALTEWERTRLSQHASANALTYMGHHARGGLKPDEIEEMERWKALSDRLRPTSPAPQTEDRADA